MAFITADHIRVGMLPKISGALLSIWPNQGPPPFIGRRRLADIDADRIGGSVQKYLRSMAWDT
jgi:hypothetical protein